MEIPETYRQKGQRRELVNLLREKGITNEDVLSAISRIPRHLYFTTDAGFYSDKAYEDRAFDIGSDQTISQPFTVARQSALLDIKPNDKVLEIGLGSGYQATVLMCLKAKVYSIERHKALYEKTSKLLPTIRQMLLADMEDKSTEKRTWKNESPLAPVKCFFGDGFEGLPMYAPFDKIIITAAVGELPRKLLQQLSVGGYMVLPFGTERDCDMVRITKQGEGQYSEEVFGKYAFVPMLKGKVN